MSRSSPFIPRFIGSNLKNFFIGAALDRERRTTAELYGRARRAFSRTPLAKQEDRDRFISDIMSEVAEQFEPLPCRSLVYALGDLIEALLSLDGLSALSEVSSIETLSIEESITLRSKLWRQLRFADDWGRLSQIWRTKVVILCHGILNELPAAARGAYHSEEDSEAGPSMSVPFYDICPDLATVIERTVLTLHDDDVVGAHLFETVREQFELSLCEVSGIPFDKRGETQKAVVLPASYKGGSNAHLVSRYLGGTPFEDLFSVQLPFEIPSETRFRGMYVVAPSGRGKTTLLKSFLARDLDLVRDGKASIVVMNSDRDLIDDVAHLDIFTRDLKGRLTIIEPDAEHPLALNLFSMGKDRLRGYSANNREMLVNTTVELFQYMFDGLTDAPMTPKQIALFIPTIRALMSIPDASIATLRDLLLSKKGYLDKYLDLLDPDTRIFFQEQFYDVNFSATKQELGWRLHGLLSRRTFAQMFSSSQCRLDLFTELNSAKVILIHTNKALLGDAQTEMFGRFFIAMILRAAQERATITRHERMSTFVYIDECQDYIRNDLNIRTILNQCRKMRIAPILSNQKLSDLSEPVQKAMLDVDIKLVNVGEEAPSLASRMRTDPEALNLPTGTFAAHINEITPRPVRLKIPGRLLDDMPKMSASAAAQIHRDMRARYSVTAQDRGPLPPRGAEPQPKPPSEEWG